MYVVGGGSFEPEGPDLDVFRLHLAGDKALQWERVRPTGTPPRCRAAHGLAWDRVGRAAYIWGGFTSGMELDSTFCALRLPPVPAAQRDQEQLPLPVPAMTEVVSELTSSSSATVQDGITFWRPVETVGATRASFVIAGYNNVPRAAVANSMQDNYSVHEATIAAAAVAAAVAARAKPGGASQVASPTVAIGGTPYASVNAPDVQQQLRPQQQQHPQQQQEHQHRQQHQHQRRVTPYLDQLDGANGGARNHGRERWRRRGQRIWRQSGDTNDDGGRVRRPRGGAGNGNGNGNSRRRPWGQGWTTGGLQGLWGGAGPGDSQGSALSALLPSPASPASPTPPAQVGAAASDAAIASAIGNVRPVRPVSISGSAHPGASDSGTPPPVLSPTNYRQYPRQVRTISSADTALSHASEQMAWVSLPSQSSLGDMAPSPAGRSFHCAFFHAGACYVTGGSDGARKFGDMWRFSARETPPPLSTLAARAIMAASEARRKVSPGGESGGLMASPDLLPPSVPEELRAALANLNMQASVVI